MEPHRARRSHHLRPRHTVCVLGASGYFIPYCTGDVHWGNNVQTYRDRPGREIVIHHKGFVNASTALRWVYARFPSPRSVFITGCSAGSVGSIAFAPYIIRCTRCDVAGEGP